MVSKSGEMRTVARGWAPPLARPDWASRTSGSSMSDRVAVLETT